MWTAPDGMFEGHFKVTPEVGGRIKACIEHGTRRRFRDARTDGTREPQDRYAADAFADAILGDPATAKSGGYTTHVLIDHETLLRGHALDGETCEIPGVGPVSVEWVRELLGSAFVTAIIKQRQGHHHRRPPRTPHPRRAAHRDDRLRPGVFHPGCSGREYLELDHCEIDHAHGGPTAQWNLMWICSIHHTRKSQGWTLGPPDPTTGKRRLDPPRASRRAA